MERNTIKKFLAYTEIGFGLFLVICGTYGMLSSTWQPEGDMHGYGLMVSIFGASVGGLMAFSGVVLFKDHWISLLAQLPLIGYCLVCYYIFGVHYA